MYMCACAKSLQSCLTLSTPQTAALQATLSMGFSKQGYWNGMSCAPPGDLPDPGIKPEFPVAPASQVDSLPLGKPHTYIHLVANINRLTHSNCSAPSSL